MTTYEDLYTHIDRVKATYNELVMEGSMKLGFTGTRKGMTDRQVTMLTRILEQYEVTELHHGDCVGADAEAHSIARSMNIRVVVHPPLNPKYRAWCDADEMRDEFPYIERNHNIVDEAIHLFAAPGTNHEIRRSGTWATVRYMRSKESGSLWLPLPD